MGHHVDQLGRPLDVTPKIVAHPRLRQLRAALRLAVSGFVPALELKDTLSVLHGKTLREAAGAMEGRDSVRDQLERDATSPGRRKGEPQAEDAVDRSRLFRAADPDRPQTRVGDQ